MDDHEKLKQRVFNAMLQKANISLNAPISPDLRQDFEIAADVLIRSTKRPLDPKKIAKHVESIQKRHQNKERDAFLPPIFVKTMNENNSPQKSSRGGDEFDHVGRAATHFDRVQREAAWAKQVQQESEEFAKNETARHVREEQEKKERLELLKQQVEEDHRKKEQERVDMRNYMDKKEAEGREIRNKEDNRDIQRKKKRMAERQANEDWLETVRDRKIREKRQEDERERQFLRKLNEQEAAEADEERRKKREKISDMRTFLQSNVRAEEDARSRMIKTRQQEIQLAPQQGIFFDGGDRRSARVMNSSARVKSVYRNFENRVGADLHREEERKKLYSYLEEPGESGVKQLQEEATTAREKKIRQQADLRKGLEEQMQQHASERNQDKHHQKQYGAWKITQRGRKEREGGVCIPGLDHSEEQEEAKKRREYKMREELKAQAIAQRKAKRFEVTLKI